MDDAQNKIMDAQEARSIKKIETLLGTPNPDGKWDPDSKAALEKKIKDVQKSNNLPVTGQYNPETAAAMRGNPETREISRHLDGIEILNTLRQLPPGVRPGTPVPAPQSPASGAIRDEVMKVGAVKGLDLTSAFTDANVQVAENTASPKPPDPERSAPKPQSTLG